MCCGSVMIDDPEKYLLCCAPKSGFRLAGRMNVIVLFKSKIDFDMEEKDWLAEQTCSSDEINSPLTYSLLDTTQGRIICLTQRYQEEFKQFMKKKHQRTVSKLSRLDDIIQEVKQLNCSLLKKACRSQQ